MMEFVFGAFSMADAMYAPAALAKVTNLEKKLNENRGQQS